MWNTFLFFERKPKGYLLNFLAKYKPALLILKNFKYAHVVMYYKKNYVKSWIKHKNRCGRYNF